MIPARPKSILILLAASLVLSSCAALDYFRPAPSAEPVEKAAQEAPAKAQEVPPKAEADNMDALEDKVNVLEDKVNTLESRVAGQKKVVYTVEYSDPAQLYKKARTLLLNHEVENAADLFETFVTAHPQHSLADNAMYWLGECHYTQGRYKESIAVFKALVNRYPKAEKVPDALLKTGYAYLSLDDANRANHFLKKVIRKYPFSPAAEKAQAKLAAFE